MSDPTPPSRPRCECGHQRRTHLYRAERCMGSGSLGRPCPCEEYAPREEAMSRA